MRNFLYFLPFLFLLSQGCDLSKDGFSGKTPSGYPYIMHVDKQGKNPVAGDKIQFYIRFRHKGMTVAEENMTGILPASGQDAYSNPDIEMLYLMSPGDSASVYVFGENLKRMAIPGLQPTDTLIYDLKYISLVMKNDELEIVRQKEKEAQQRIEEGLALLRNGDPDGRLMDAGKGVKYLIHQEGSGMEAKPMAVFTVNYFGALQKDGKPFENTYQRKEPFVFQMGTKVVLEGWELAFEKFKKGTKATILIPAVMGYGVLGASPYIGPNEDLVYYVEVVDLIDNQINVGGDPGGNSLRFDMDEKKLEVK